MWGKRLQCWIHCILISIGRRSPPTINWCMWMCFDKEIVLTAILIPCFPLFSVAFLVNSIHFNCDFIVFFSFSPAFYRIFAPGAHLHCGYCSCLHSHCFSHCRLLIRCHRLNSISISVFIVSERDFTLSQTHWNRRIKSCGDLDKCQTMQVSNRISSNESRCPSDERILFLFLECV